MRLSTGVLLFGTALILCGNVFAVSPYAYTIQKNIPKKSFLSVASFPTTIADAGFIARIENKYDGYLPYFNRSAFADLPLEEQDELELMARRAEYDRRNAYLTQPHDEFCTNYPYDSTCPGEDDTDTTQSDEPDDRQTTTSDGSIYPITHPTITTNIPPIATTPNMPDNRYMRMALTPENITKYNLKTHNGGCTPPERSDHWRNIIETTGHYQYTHPAFEKFMITAFRKEGDCGSHPNDHGGYTCYGCASRGLCRGIPMQSVTRAMVEDLAFDKFYKKYGVEKLPDAFRGYILWGIWGSGPETGIKQFQGALNVPLTGKIDAATIRAAENYTGDFADQYTKNREQFYRNIVARDPSQRVFLKGWLNALTLLRPSGCHVVPTNPIYR